ncbi:MAG: DNA alkylation repair protein, partial [Clostridia bacterium]
MDTITEELFRLQDTGYAAMQVRIIPTVAADRIIGVRTPALRTLAKELAGSPEAAAFLASLPHRYFDEDQLHAFVISL